MSTVDTLLINARILNLVGRLALLAASHTGDILDVLDTIDKRLTYTEQQLGTLEETL